MIDKLKRGVGVIREISFEIVAGIVADKVEQIIANRRAAHAHRPTMFRVGATGSYHTLDGVVVLFGPPAETEWVVPFMTHGEDDPKVVGVVKWTTTSGIKLCRDCGQLYFTEERS